MSVPLRKSRKGCKYNIKRPEFTQAQKDRIREYYASATPLEFNLDVLAAEFGKHKSNICHCARKMGLTDQTRPNNAIQDRASRQTKWRDKPHPRGMTGKTHSAENREIFSRNSKLMWATFKTLGIGLMSEGNRQRLSDRMSLHMSKQRPTHVRSSNGHRADLGNKFFRSKWEANYARYLNLLMKMGVVVSWEFEPETFWFNEIKRGVRSYLVDFKVHYKGEARPVYVEVKGWMDPKSKTKIARFKKYYPQHRLEIVGEKEYRALKHKWGSAIPGWEGR